MQLVHHTVIILVQLIGKKPAEIQAKRAGLKWQLNLHEVIDFLIFLTGSFDKKAILLMKKHLKKGDVLIDIGANIGSMAMHFATTVGETGKVYAIEPSTYAYIRMHNNLRLNPSISKQLTLSQHFVSKPSKKLPEGVYASWNMRKGTERHDGHMGSLTSTEGATSISLDEYVQQKKINKIDWLKIDVDGFECDVLGGAREVLSKHQPKIFIELSEYPLIENGESLDSMLQFLFDQNYSIFDLNGNNLGTDVDVIRRTIPKMGATNAFAFRN